MAGQLFLAAGPNSSNNNKTVWITRLNFKCCDSGKRQGQQQCKTIRQNLSLEESFVPLDPWTFKDKKKLSSSDWPSIFPFDFDVMTLT